jgi:hypothetical protein
MEPENMTFEELEHRAAVQEQRAVEAKKKVMATFATIANAALVALSVKALVIYSLTLMAGAFAWSLADPSVLRVAAATIFSLILILAGVFKEKKDGN